MKFYQKLTFIFGIIFFIVQPTLASINVGATRVIFSESNNSQSVDINNRSNNQPYLINVGISDSLDAKSTGNAFMATPALFRVEPGSGNKVRLIKKTTNLPRDRESVFYLNVMAIPASKAGDRNGTSKVGGTLQVATGNTIKIFYRPDNLPVTQKEAMTKLQFARSGQSIKVLNPTPYYISLNKLSFDGKEAVLDVMKGTSMIAPFSSNSYHVSGLPARAEWTAINDFGGKEKFNGHIK